MKERFENIDLLKALAIYFVVIYHFNIIPINVIEPDSCWNYFNYYLKSILSTCVPIFFFVNGWRKRKAVMQQRIIYNNNDNDDNDNKPELLSPVVSSIYLRG